MAGKGLDYSLQLPDVAAPQESRAGALFNQAGHTQGEANRLSGQIVGEGIKFLGTTATDAVKGKLDAGLRGELNDATDKLEGLGPTALASQQNLLNVQDDIASFSDNPPQQPEQIKAFGDETARFINAQNQGILSKGEVVTRISAAVKKYSAMMPGLASDFRRIAAEETGIQHADVYGVHKALTTEGSAEKLAVKQQEAQLALDKGIAEEQGVALNQITPEMRSFHYANKQLKIAAETATQRMGMTNLARGEADRAWGQIYSMKLGAAATDIASDFSRMFALNSDPNKAAESSQFGLQLSSKIGVMVTQMERDIAEMSRPEPGRTALSLDAQQKMLTEWRSTAKNWQDAAKEIEGRNFMGSAVKNAQQSVELLVSNFKIANPHLTVLNTYGSVSEIVKAWFAIGNKDEFNKRFPGLGPAVEKVMETPQYHAGINGQIYSGAGVNLPQVARMAPELAQVVASDMVQSIKVWSKEENPTPQRKDVFANTFAAFYSTPANFNPTVKRNLDAAYSTLSSEDTQRFFSQMTSEQRSRALLPMVGNLERATFDVGTQIRAELAKWNDVDTNIAARSGVTLSLERNTLTGAFEVREGRASAKPAVLESPSGAATAVVRGDVTTPRTDASAARKRASDLTTTLNQMLETYTLGVRSLGVEGVNTNLRLAQEMAELGIKAGKPEPLTPHLKLPEASADVPKNTTSSGVDLDRAEQAVVKAENSGANATSPKGAAGIHQFMPETAKDYGLKIDPAAGIDERRDPAKSAPAAKKYLNKLAGLFKGDMEKVAAAYNAGEGSVQAAVQKASDLGVPDHWRAFLPKPKETVPYIERFMKAYGVTKPIRMASQ